MVMAVESICRCLRDVVSICLVDCLEFEYPQHSALPIKKKNKDLKSGDIVLPWYIKTCEEKAQKLLLRVDEELRAKCSFIKKVSQDKHNILSFHLDRPTVTRDVLKQVHEKGLKYGHCNTGQGYSVMLHPFIDGYNSHGRTMMTESPVHMRIFYIMVHLKRILDACGYQVLCNEKLQDAECLSEHEDIKASHLNHILNTEELAASAKLLLSKDEESDDGILDLRPIIQRENLFIGKDGLDKNLTKAEVFTADGKITDIVREVAEFDVKLDSSHFNNNVVHIVPQGKVFKLQQMIVLHAGISKTKINQSHLTIGPVICKGDIPMKQFQSSRYNQMKEASEMRHGVKCEGPVWEGKINQLSQAGIKLEVLGNALHCPLKMDLHPSHSTENRLGAFVLYNTARLATLLRQFSQEVENGTYPPLPPIEDINFSLLREQEEWELVYLYVASFPITVKESVEAVFPDQGRLASKIHTHKITNFLISFSKCLSSYYSRYHILGGPEVHLLPLMYARLHLVQACHQVMTNGLQLLDIQPLEEL